MEPEDIKQLNVVDNGCLLWDAWHRLAVGLSWPERCRATAAAAVTYAIYLDIIEIRRVYVHDYPVESW